MIYLAFYDQRGQCQRVARVNSREQAGAFLQAGFIEVDRDEYERCAAIVPEATTQDLNRLQVARQLTQRIQTTERQLLQLDTDPQALDRLTERQRAKLQGITQSFISGALDSNQWYRQMVNAINAANVAATALGVGGFENITNADRQEIERANETQVRYLNGFRRSLDTLSDAKKVARAALYAGATTSRYWTAHTRAQGLVLPAMPGVRTSCGSNCKCNWQITRLDGEGNWDCHWRVSSVEHCEECIQRQRIFNPLRIRNFQPETFNPSGIYK